MIDTAQANNPDPATDLAGKTRRTLRAKAHALKPVVWIAQSGATAAVLQEIDRALTAHELVKIHAAVDGRTTREEMLVSICNQLGAQPVQVIGKMLVAFRPRPAVAENPPEDRKKGGGRRPTRAATSPRHSNPRPRRTQGR